MELFRKITDFIMPPVEEEVEEVVETSGQQTSQMVGNEEVADRMVANGGTMSYGGTAYQAAESQRPAYERMTYEPVEESARAARSQFKVHTTAKVQDLRMQVYVPVSFDQVASIADDLKDKRAVIVNYEKVDLAEQRRICDFVNGVCYVSDGDARRISQNIVLYVPEGIEVSDAMAMAFAN